MSQERERDFWRSFDRERPESIEVAGPGQESVWDYPRPPRVERVARRVRVEFAGVVVADTHQALRVVETASPPVYYLPPDGVRRQYLSATLHQTFCEWKGMARYWSVRVGSREVRDAAWSYPNPEPGFEAIRDFLAFYPSRMDACWLGDERVMPQPGEFYGGWVTREIVGPFKGVPGSSAW